MTAARVSGLVSLLLVLGCPPTFVRPGEASPPPGPAGGPDPAPELSAVDLYRQVVPAVVRVVVADRQGTGFLLGRRDRVITAMHVVASGRAIVVVDAGGARIPAKVLRLDSALDLVELRLDRPLDAEPLALAEDLPEVGAPVCLIGHPFPSLISGPRGNPALAYTLSCGRVSNRGGGFLQIDAPVNPGQSGGPLLNMRGRVVGVVLRRFRQAENIAQAREFGFLQILEEREPVEGFPGATEGYFRLGWTWRSQQKGGLRHGPVLAGGLRFFDWLEVGVLGAMTFDSDAGASDGLGVRRLDIGLGVESGGRLLVGVGGGRYLALRLSVAGGALVRTESERMLVLEAGDACPNRSHESCSRGSVETLERDQGVRAWLMPSLGLDLGLFELVAVAEMIFPGPELTGGGGLLISF